MFLLNWFSSIDAFSPLFPPFLSFVLSLSVLFSIGIRKWTGWKNPTLQFNRFDYDLLFHRLPSLRQKSMEDHLYPSKNNKTTKQIDSKSNKTNSGTKWLVRFCFFPFLSSASQEGYNDVFTAFNWETDQTAHSWRINPDGLLAFNIGTDSQLMISSARLRWMAPQKQTPETSGKFTLINLYIYIYMYLFICL